MKTESKHKKYTPLFFVLIAIFVTCLGFIYANNEQYQVTDDAYINADYTWVAPKLNGIIESVLVKDNQVVKAGQILAHLDSADYITELHAAEANILKNEAEVFNVEALLKKQFAEINQVQAIVERDIAQVKFAMHEYERYQNLAHQGAGTIQFTQQAKANKLKAEAQLENSRAILEAAKTQIEVLEASKKSAQAKMNYAKAMLEKAKLNVSYTKLVAPFDGIIGKRTLRKGAYVNAGDALMAIVPLKSFYVTANFREVQLTDVQPGQRVSVIVDTYPNEVLKGSVESIAPATGVTFSAIAPTNATGNFTKVVQRIPVRIILEKDQDLLETLKVGMSVEATIKLN